MGSILAFFAKHLGLPIVWGILQKIFSEVSQRIKAYMDKKKSEKTAEEARKKMEQSQTAQEIDNAADDTLSGV